MDAAAPAKTQAKVKAPVLFVAKNHIGQTTPIDAPTATASAKAPNARRFNALDAFTLVPPT